MHMANIDIKETKDIMTPEMLFGAFVWSVYNFDPLRDMFAILDQIPVEYSPRDEFYALLHIARNARREEYMHQSVVNLLRSEIVGMLNLNKMVVQTGL